MGFLPGTLPLGWAARVSLVRQTFPMTSSRLQSGGGARAGLCSVGDPGPPPSRFRAPVGSKEGDTPVTCRAL